MKKNKLEVIILSFVFLLGFLLRIHAYAVNNSFFLDEILLAFNVMQKNYLQLLQPLQYDQAAPFLFLYSTKLIISKFGFSELIFRLIPFLSSLASVIAFYFLCKKVFERVWVRILALLLFCVNFQLLFYAQAFKQYSSDVLIAILILLTALSVNVEKIKWQQALILGILSSIAFCFSFTSIFVIIGISLVYLFYKKEFKKTFIYILPNFFTLTWYFLLTLQTTKNNNMLNNYWANGYNFFSPEFYSMNFNFIFTFYTYPLFCLFLLIAGIIWIYKSDKFKALIITSPLIITVLAGFLKIYPFERRLILFLVPIFLILVAFPLDKVKLNKNYLNIITITVSSIFFLNYFIIYSCNFISGKVSYLRQGVKPLLATLIKEKQPKDILYIYYGSNKTYLYYNLLLNLPKDNLYLGAMPAAENWSPDFIVKDLSNIPKHKTIWFFFVKGDGNYEKDVKIYRNWLYKNSKVEKDVVLKSARLIKVFL